jgi:hypothetical protein
MPPLGIIFRKFMVKRRSRKWFNETNVYEFIIIPENLLQRLNNVIFSGILYTVYICESRQLYIYVSPKKWGGGAIRLHEIKYSS